MLRVAVLVALVALAWGQAPDFCHGRDCPKYTVLSKGEGYELRRYDPTVWVATTYTVEAGQHSRPLSILAFRKLYHYMAGDNKQGTRMRMTLPVLKRYEESPDGRRMKTMMFMVPFDLQNSVPEPRSPDLMLVQQPQLDVYVRTFGGFAYGARKRMELDRLKAAIGDPSLYDDTAYFRATYDKPWKMFNRHNELWLVSKKATDNPSEPAIEENSLPTKGPALTSDSTA